ncbi:hypothetical protein [Cryptosporangium sp. NPDC048952]
MGLVVATEFWNGEELLETVESVQRADSTRLRYRVPTDASG